MTPLAWMDFGIVPALLIGGGLVVGYQIYLGYRERREPGFAIHGLNALARLRWVESVMADGRQDVLAVQTLRNSLMAASMMASTAILLVIGTLNLGAQGARLEALLQPLSTRVHGSAADHALIVLLLLADFFVAFFFFSMAIRYFNHVGYMVNLPQSAKALFPPHRVAAYLNRAGRFYSLGTRAFHMCVPLVFGLFGPIYLVVAAVGLVIALDLMDRPPPSEIPTRSVEPGSRIER
jgi:uncharacterized membrane protein